MIAIETAIRFAVAWLAIGLGLYIAGGSISGLRTAVVANGHPARGVRRVVPFLYVVPLIVGVGVLYVAALEVIRVVPW